MILHRKGGHSGRSSFEPTRPARYHAQQSNYSHEYTTHHLTGKHYAAYNDALNEDQRTSGRSTPDPRLEQTMTASAWTDTEASRSFDAQSQQYDRGSRRKAK